MKNIFSIALMFACVAAIEFHGSSIPLTTCRSVEVPDFRGATTLNHELSFMFPESLLLPSTVIYEAFLEARILPSREIAPSSNIDIVAMPMLLHPTERDLTPFSTVGNYDPATGKVFFEISYMLQCAADDSFDIVGVKLLPSPSSTVPTAFTIDAGMDAITLKAEYRPGKREVMRR